MSFARTFLIASCFLIACLSQAANGVVADERNPNVVVLLADDLGCGDLGCYGGPVKTPALDALAAQGVRFTNFYAGAPVCSTSRAVLLTGRHHLRTGVYTVIQDHVHQMHLRRDEVTLAELLKQNGYQTVHSGKWHLGTPFRSMDKPWIDEHGFDHWFATDLNAAPSHRNPTNFWRNRKRVGPLEGYACDLVVDEATTWLDQHRDPKRPFFLNLWFHEPHAPLAAPPEIVSDYGDRADQAAIYSATIDNTDRAISRLISKLKEIGEFNDTIVIYTSDHGSYRHERNGGCRAGKGSLYDGGLRTPGIVCWPSGITPGFVEETPAGAIDLVPTICGLLQIDPPKNAPLDGVDLSGVLRREETGFQRSRPLTWHSPTSQPVVAIRHGNYSLVGFREAEYPKDKAAIDSVMAAMGEILEQEVGRPLSRSELWHQCYNSPLNTPEWKKLRSKFVMLNTFQESWIPLIKDGFGGTARFELYDLSVDPAQQHNLITKKPDLARRLKQHVLAVHGDVLDEAPDWGTAAKKKTIHRLSSAKRSPFDAFVYVNRIPIEREVDETHEDLAGRILGRLANQEGRVLVKLPPGMGQRAYEGFKTSLHAAGANKLGHCYSCHQFPDLGDGESVPSLRNLSLSPSQLSDVLAGPTHDDYSLTDDELKQLHAFVGSLGDVSEADFRKQILQATVMDNTGDFE